MQAGGWKSAWALAAAAVVALRAAVGAVMAGTWLALKPVLMPVIQSTPNIYGLTPFYQHSPADFLLGVWLRWDAVHYINLATGGYIAQIDGDSVFYPLYPLLVRVVSFLTFGEPVSAALIVSTLAALATFASLYRLAEDEFGAASARWSVAALAVYPTALFLVAPFTEGLFLALTLGSFYSARRGRWLVAGILGALASLARGPGIYTALALAWLAWTQWRAGARSPRQVVTRLAGLALPVLGGLLFMVWRQWAGYAPIPEILQQYSGLTMTNPFSGLWLAVREMFVNPGFTVILEGLSALGWLGVFAIMLVNPRWRKPEWLIFMALNLGVFFSKHSFIASPLQSVGRYVLVLFPGFILLGDWLARMRPRRRFALVTSSSALLLVFSALYAVAMFVG
jgi:hypothetical protein